MKTILIAIIINLSILNILLSQQQSNVKTPISEENNVTAYVRGEASESQLEYWDNYYNLTYSNAIKIPTYGSSYSATQRFNCHGYAWYMTESGHGLDDPRWIGLYEVTDEDIYMTDGSYVEVESAVWPGKVSWPSTMNHSAITTEQGGVWISKWGPCPLYKHNWDDSPFGSENLKYYKLYHEKILHNTIYTNLLKILSILYLQDVTIKNNVNVHFDIDNNITIEGLFKVGLGSTLIIE